MKKVNFEVTDKLLENFYSRDIDTMPRDYYLFSFTDMELIDIVRNRDEWGMMDFLLARNILKERGMEVDDDLANVMRTNRLVQLSQAEKAPSLWVTAGYIFAFLGGFIGIIIGYILISKKTLPNGDTVYVYSEGDRKHGKRILTIATVVLVLALFVNIFIGMQWD